MRLTSLKISGELFKCNMDIKELNPRDRMSPAMVRHIKRVPKNALLCSLCLSCLKAAIETTKDSFELLRFLV